MNVYLPTAGGTCLECGWGKLDYDSLEQWYPCEEEQDVATDAPSSLGALAASLQAIECRKLLDGNLDSAASGPQILIDASTQKHYVTSSRMNTNCNFDHRVWDIRKLDGELREVTIAGLFDAARAAGVAGEPKLVVDAGGFPFATFYPRCGQMKRVLGLAGRLHPRRVRCQCGERMMAGGPELVREVAPARLTASCRPSRRISGRWRSAQRAAPIPGRASSW